MKIPFPREHGTWAMLYAPVLCAVLSTGSAGPFFALFLISTTAAFFLRDPLEAWFRLRNLPTADPDRKAYLRNWVIAYSLLAIVPAVVLILPYGRWLLAAFGALFAGMLWLHMKWTSERIDRHVLSELAAVLALTSSAPACRYVITGALDSVSFLLWMLNALFFSSSVFYLKMRVSRAVKKNGAAFYTRLCIGYHTVLVVLLAILARQGMLSWYVLPAFAPVVARAFQGILARGKLNLLRIGIAEVAYTVAFVLFLTFAF